MSNWVLCDPPSCHDASTHQIWDSYLKSYRRYTPEMISLEIRSEVNVKITVTPKWYPTLSYPKMHPQTRFGIPTYPDLGFLPKSYRRYTPEMISLEIRSEVNFKITVTPKWYPTLSYPKMHPQTKFEIPTSNNIRDMLRTRLF